jgi:hypothetical protein
MAGIKSRERISLGFVFGTQNIDVDTDLVVREKIVNVWGADYQRLELEEAVLFEAHMRKRCNEAFLHLMDVAMEAAADFGLETVIGVPSGTDPLVAARDSGKTGAPKNVKVA